MLLQTYLNVSPVHYLWGHLYFDKTNRERKKCVHLPGKRYKRTKHNNNTNKLKIIKIFCKFINRWHSVRESHSRYGHWIELKRYLSSLPVGTVTVTHRRVSPARGSNVLIPLISFEMAFVVASTLRPHSTGDEAVAVMLSFPIQPWDSRTDVCMPFSRHARFEFDGFFNRSNRLHLEMQSSSVPQKETVKWSER